MTACTCPSPPAIAPADPVPTGPIRCACCGAPLELTCAQRCGKVAESIAAAMPEYSRNNSAHKTTRKYTPKACGCGKTFTPTGPADKRCPACKAGGR